MRIIKVDLIVDDTCNPSDQDVIEYVREMINEVFGKEERQEYPRCKLIFMRVEHKNRP